MYNSFVSSLCSFLLPSFISLFVIVHLVVPEQSLVAITPGKGLAPDVQVLVLWSFGGRWAVGFVLPMLVPQSVGVGAGNEERGESNVKGQLPPELCGNQVSIVFQEQELNSMECPWRAGISIQVAHT